MSANGTSVISIRIGKRTDQKLKAIAAEYDVTVGQLVRFMMANITERDVKRTLMASIARIADDDRDDVPEAEEE